MRLIQDKSIKQQFGNLVPSMASISKINNVGLMGYLNGTFFCASYLLNAPVTRILFKLRQLIRDAEPQTEDNKRWH